MIGVFGSLEIISILRYFYPFGSVKRNPSSRLRAVKRTLLLTKHPDWDLLERILLDFSVVVCGVKVDQPRPLLLLLNPSAGGELIAKRHVYIYVNHLVTMVTRECGDCRSDSQKPVVLVSYCMYFESPLKSVWFIFIFLKTQVQVGGMDSEACLSTVNVPSQLAYYLQQLLGITFNAKQYISCLPYFVGLQESPIQNWHMLAHQSFGVTLGSLSWSL